jgi:hypothetical protein
MFFYNFITGSDSRREPKSLKTRIKLLRAYGGYLGSKRR